MSVDAAGKLGFGPVSEVLKRIGAIAQAQSVSAVWDIAADCFRGCGFDRLNYGLTRFRSERSMGDPEDALYLTTSEPEYSQLYFRDGLFRRTPIFRWLLGNTGTTTWRWVHDDFAAGRLSAGEAEAVRINARFGVFAGVTISFPDTQRTKGALGLAADPGLDHDDVDDIMAEHGAAIEAVAQVMHLRILSLPANHARRGLTPRQREVLEWVADGKTTQDVALLMSISGAMVEKHLRLAREALNVETTAQAVAKGTLLNLIFTGMPPHMAMTGAALPEGARKASAAGMDSPTYADAAVGAS